MEDHKDPEVILLDTHALIWLKAEPGKLSGAASEAIRAARQSDGLAISAITLWELAWLAANGRISFSGTLDSFVEEMASRTSIRPITHQIAVWANRFTAAYPNDPSDRLIGATALIEGIALVTKDRAIRSYGQIKTVW